MLNKNLTFLFFFAFFVVFSQATESIITTEPATEPQSFKSFNINQNTQVGSPCSYTVTIKTSCSSTPFTRDQISIAFGDAFGNQVYAPRVDDPSSRTFERCSTDTFQISGPCMHGPICYQYVYRAGSDGWKPETVKIYPFHSRGVVFTYNSFIPYGTWFGFNFCSGHVSAI